MSVHSILETATKNLNASNYDVAAGMNERAFNDFLDAHWKTETQNSNNVYNGMGRLNEVGITYHYNVKSPAAIDLRPIRDSLFMNVMKGWASTVPELSDVSEQLFATDNDNSAVPPNFQIAIREIDIRVETDTGISVVLQLKAKITGYVTTVHRPGSVGLKLVPIDARIEDQESLVEQIAQSVGSGREITPADCVELRRLVLYIINVLLANRIGSFVREFDIPLPIELIRGISITDFDLEVIEDTIFIRTTVDARLVQNLPSNLEAITMLQTADEMKIGVAKIEQLGDDIYRSSCKEQNLIASPLELTISDLSQAVLPDKGIFLLLHQRFFQILANKFLVLDQRKTDTGRFLGINWEVGTHLRTWNPVARVVGSGLNVAAEFSGRAWIKLWISTHCGDVSHTTSATATGTPRIRSRFFFDRASRDSMWVEARPRPFEVDWRIGGIPFPFNKILELLLEFFTNIGILFVVFFGARWKSRITDIPNNFPGTDIEFTPNFDRRVVKVEGEQSLIVAAEPDFHP